MYSSVWYPVTYRWRTDGVQMTFRWRTDEIQLTCLKCMKVLSIKSVESILSAFTWHKLYLFMRLSSEMLWGSYFCFKSFGWVIVGDWLFDDTYNLVLLCKSPFVFRKSLNEWLLVIGWWNKGDLNPWWWWGSGCLLLLGSIGAGTSCLKWPVDDHPLMGRGWDGGVKV